ncbi:MAG: response regulator [Candidatus Omnitrophica bacterium]|nr:response regulator [Candidatus Omnitrophota bacterium]
MRAKKAKILVIDDQEEICELTKAFLLKKDHIVFTATTQEEALKNLIKEKPHIILLDMILGEISGLDVLAKIREIDKKVKVIIVTGLYDDDAISKAKAMGIDDYIVKPFTADFLNNLILQKLFGASPKPEIK